MSAARPAAGAFVALGLLGGPILFFGGGALLNWLFGSAG